MKKRLFAIMLALAMLLAAVPALAEEGKVEVEEQNQDQKKISCATEGCTNKVEGEGNLCATCATAKKVAEEEAAAKKAAEEEALRKAAEEEAARKAAEEEAAKKAAEEAAKKKAAEGKTEGLKATPGETNQAGTGADGNCHHDHTAAWASTHTDVQGTMVWHAPTEPTCAKEGNIGYYQCNKCGKYFKKNGSSNIDVEPAIEINLSDTVIPKTSEHTLGEKVTGKPATCTEAGNIEYYECSVCEGKFADSNGTQSVENVVIPALGHSVPADGDYTVKPTCTTPGRAKYICSKCNTELNNVEIPALGHSYGAPIWNWCGFTSASAIFTCTRNCGHSETETASVVGSSINSCGYYTYTATVKFNGETYTNTRTDYSCRPDWYYDPCYYNNPCGHWGCGDVCTRYSNCVPCQNYRTTFRVGGYNCLATPKTGDASVIAPAMLALIGSAGAALGKKRR